MDRPEWTRRAAPVAHVSVDVGFYVPPIYHGPENDVTPSAVERRGCWST